MLRKRIEFEFLNEAKGSWKKKRFEGTNGVILLPANSILRGPTCMVLDKEDLYKFHQKEKRVHTAWIDFSYQDRDCPVSRWDRIRLERKTDPEFRGWECKSEFLLISELNEYKRKCLTESTREVSILGWNMKELPKLEMYQCITRKYCLVLYEDKTGEVMKFTKLVDLVEQMEQDREPGDVYEINHIIIPVGDSGYSYALRPSQLAALMRIQFLSVKATVSAKEGFDHTFETVSIEDRIEPQFNKIDKLRRIMKLCLCFPQLVYLERCAEKEMEDQNELQITIDMKAEYGVNLSISDMDIEAGFQLFDCICKMSQLAHEKINRIFDLQ